MRVTPNSDSERFSPLHLARILGILGLGTIATGAFDIGYVQGTLIVAGDPVTTLHNISTHETLFRCGFSAHILTLVCNILGEIISFMLFWRVNWIAAATCLCTGIVATGIEGVDLLSEYVPLTLATGGSAFASAFSAEQLHSLAYICLQLQPACLLLSYVFYGVDELAGGFLIFRSGFLPRVLGVLLGFAGFCYFTNGLLSFLAPALDARLNPGIQLACFPGEFGSSLWLAIVGVNVVKWRAWIARS